MLQIIFFMSLVFQEIFNAVQVLVVTNISLGTTYVNILLHIVHACNCAVLRTSMLCLCQTIFCRIFFHLNPAQSVARHNVFGSSFIYHRFLLRFPAAILFEWRNIGHYKSSPRKWGKTTPFTPFCPKQSEYAVACGTYLFYYKSAVIFLF